MKAIVAILVARPPLSLTRGKIRGAAVMVILGICICMYLCVCMCMNNDSISTISWGRSRIAIIDIHAYIHTYQ
jgi:hypothetical protein